MIAGNKTTVNGSMNCYVQESPSVKRRCYAFVKRAFDIVASAAALIILSPIMLIAAILVYVDDPGKVFYGHVRIGKNGKPFKMWKFRSMYMNADKMIDLLTPEQAKQYYEYSGFGIPMLANDIPGLKNTVGNAGAAECIELKSNNIVHAIQKIEEDYDTYSENAKKFFAGTDNLKTMKKLMGKIEK